MDKFPTWKPRRKILGMSAILLPVTEELTVDWSGFRGHVQRTLDAGLVPAVNMDTGYANLIDEATRVDVLRETQQLCGASQFVAGAFVGDQSGDAYDADAYKSQIEQIQQYGGTPVIFQSFGLTELTDEAIISAYSGLATETDQFIAFELGKVFAPFGSIYSLETYQQLLQIPQCMGAKHSSLDRKLEWQRLEIRDRIRPEFHVFTGNDLAIDMVMYGSDYLLGLSTMAPDLFALRDQLWKRGDAEFFHLNDWLQYLGFLTFRSPTPAYKHSAAQFLKLRGWIDCDHTYPGSPCRPDSDRAILQTLLEGLDKWQVASPSLF
ncbi:MAG: dihydrodipicolinate synthase family protein [bacterium]|nr:dihydrodipicolinate synthase family protein [bacterium]